VLGDADRLQQIFWNLLSNAIKFTPRGGRVQVRVLRADAEMEVVVSDTGEGIDPAFLPHVFERFRQADASPQRLHGGLGLGLAIVKHLVDLHGGTVSAASDGRGQGSTFIVRLPMLSLIDSSAAPGPPATTHPPGQVLAAGATTGSGPMRSRPPLAALRVLAVDDDRDSLNLVALTLRQVGAEVFPAASAAEALALLAEQPVDVLVADIQMPGEDGYELMRKVRARSPRQGGNIRAAALTASARREDVSRALRAGYEVHIAKPVEPGELTAAIARLLGR
jgi:CheY-like chemotaxis protein/anti-sigma regulatory factor (Ser/Thr protein kinase)